MPNSLGVKRRGEHKYLRITDLTQEVGRKKREMRAREQGNLE